MILPEHPKLPRETLPNRLYMRGTGHREAEAPTRAHRQPIEFVFRELATRVALQIRERRKHEAVLHRGPAQKSQGFKKHPIPFELVPG